MQEIQLKSLAQLNRAILLVQILSVLTCTALTGQVLYILPLLVNLLATMLLFANEILLRRARQCAEATPQTQISITFGIPTVFLILTWLMSWAAQTPLFLLWGWLPMLQAHLLGRSRLAKLLGIFNMAAFILVLAWQWSPSSTYYLVAGGSLWAMLYAFGRQVCRQLKIQSGEVGKLQSMAATDGLTGLANRRLFNLRLQEEVARSRRHGTALTLALFDLDDFKSLNDIYGHPMGDRVLREVSNLLRHNIRESDLPARYGGEEFALILPETKESEAYELLERIRLLVAQTVFCMPEQPLTISISVGVAELNRKLHASSALVDLADKALYEAKHQGKNQVVKGSSLYSKMLLQQTGA